MEGCGAPQYGWAQASEAGRACNQGSVMQCRNEDAIVHVKNSQHARNNKFYSITSSSHELRYMASAQAYDNNGIVEYTRNDRRAAIHSMS